MKKPHEKANKKPLEKPPPASLFKKIRALFSPKEPVTEDDVRSVLIEGEKSGAVESEERKMAEGVFYLGDRPVEAFMTHRSEIEWLDIDCDAETAKETAIKHTTQRFFPVARETLDEIVGIVAVEDILVTLLENRWEGIGAITKKARFIPETMPALKAFQAFNHHNENYICVMDEYGGFAGSLTLRDLLEAIVGELSLSASSEEPILQQPDGTWLADGNVNIDDLAEKIDLSEAGDDHKEYHTLAGYILSMAEEIPKTGAEFTRSGFTFKIVDMDGNRIDKVWIAPAGN
ncbi:MAG: hemolysin family protein [Spirochaetaceae bacterium]|nr:hemolysin family protein [Spirochaetaceae bacterium]